jgi:hypothetical protein
MNNCYSCRLWAGEGVRERGPHGACHRYPPIVTDRYPDGKFPRTLSTDWCAEWRPHPASEPEREFGEIHDWVPLSEDPLMPEEEISALMDKAISAYLQRFPNATRGQARKAVEELMERRGD